MSQDLKIIDNLKKNINFQNGFFLEVGAHDGLFQSNTLYYERELNWGGILIEPSFENYLKCLINRPNIKTINCALTSNYYLKKNKTLLLENNNSPMAKTKNFNFLNNLLGKNYVNANAISLGRLLNNLNIKKLDLLSLDVEGEELSVLQGINFENVNIKFICIEVWDNQKDQIFEFLKKEKYKLTADLSEFNKKDFPNWSGDHNDYLFERQI